jgi:hypothetical protein
MSPVTAGISLLALMVFVQCNLEHSKIQAESQYTVPTDSAAKQANMSQPTNAMHMDAAKAPVAAQPVLAASCSSALRP